MAQRSHMTSALLAREEIEELLSLKDKNLAACRIRATVAESKVMELQDRVTELLTHNNKFEARARRAEKALERSVDNAKMLLNHVAGDHTLGRETRSKILRELDEDDAVLKRKFE